MEYKVYDYWFKNIRTSPNIFREWIPISKKLSDQKLKEIEPYLPLVVKMVYKCIVSPEIFRKRLIACFDDDSKKFLEYVIIIDQFLRTLENKYKKLSDFKDYITINLMYVILRKFNQYPFKLDRYYRGYEAVFILMPLKHSFNILNKTSKYNGYERIIMNFMKKVRTYYSECDIFDKFYNDTVVKYYKLFTRNELHYIDRTTSQIRLDNQWIDTESDFSSICEHYNTAFFENNNSLELVKIDNIVLDFVNKNSVNSKICVSLSGGVDSMVTLYSLYKLKKLNLINNSICAFHINYNNRNESFRETELVYKFCKHLFIDTYIYNINFIKRCEIKRDTYEKLTREIRFNCYNIITGNKGIIFLGHIKDDLIENIITNFSTNKHITNLGKFKSVDVIENVLIGRPFIRTYKKYIEEYAYKFRIPFLLNTTPEWSNRGKFRNRFLNEFKNQYGEQSVNNVEKAAQQIESMSNLLEKMVIKPLKDEIIKSGTLELNDDLLSNKFIVYQLFEAYFHSKGESKPSHRSVDNLLKVIPSNKKYMLKKDYIVHIKNYSLYINYTKES